MWSEVIFVFDVHNLLKLKFLSFPFWLGLIYKLLNINQNMKKIKMIFVIYENIMV